MFSMYLIVNKGVIFSTQKDVPLHCRILHFLYVFIFPIVSFFVFLSIFSLLFLFFLNLQPELVLQMFLVFARNEAHVLINFVLTKTKECIFQFHTIVKH